jgi:hypothetical protein
MFIAEQDKKDRAPERSGEKSLSADYQLRADRLILADYAPPGVLINDNFDILQFRGGDPTFSVATGRATDGQST